MGKYSQDTPPIPAQSALQALRGAADTLPMESSRVRSGRVNEYASGVSRAHGWYWHPISTAGLIAFFVGTAWLFLLLRTDKDGFIVILDDVNLAVHEFGHPFFGTFGDSAELWGGTLAQLLLPLAIAAVFVYQRAALSTCVAGVWFFENFFNVARYIADARAQQLPLVGGGEHDWANILGRHGLLNQDLAIASVVRTTGWIGMVACLLLAIVLWNRQRGGVGAAAEPTAPTAAGPRQ